MYDILYIKKKMGNVINIALKGKIAIVTGSIQRIGFDIYRMRNSHVINNNRDAEKLGVGDTLCSSVRSMTLSHLSGGRNFDRYLFSAREDFLK